MTQNKLSELLNTEINNIILYSDLLSKEKYRYYSTSSETSFYYWDSYQETNIINICLEQQAMLDAFYHEMAHSFYSPKDAKQFEITLEKNKIPHLIWNLFEDIRIEKQTENNGIYTYWISEESKKFVDDIMKKIENSGKISPYTAINTLRFKREIPEYFPDDKADRVKLYFDKTQKAQTQEELIDIILRFMKEFPPNGNLNDYSALIIQDGTNDYIHYQKNGYNIKGKFHAEEIINQSPQNKIDNITVDERLIETLKQICAEKVVEEGTEEPSSRVDLRNYIIKQYDSIYLNKTTVSRDKIGVNLIVDCSGSMENYPIDNAKELIKAFIVLANRGVVEGKILFSSSFINDQFNLKDKGLLDYTANVTADGEEGFAVTIPDFKQHTKKAKFVIVISDGNIAENSIRKDLVDLLGDYSYACYVGEFQDISILSRLCSNVIAKDRLNGLVDELIYQMKGKNSNEH